MDTFDNFDAYLQLLAPSSSGGSEESIAFNLCPQCHVPMSVKTNGQYLCASCGLLNEVVEATDLSTVESNVNYTSVTSGLRCAGNNAHRYQTILRAQSSGGATPEVHVHSILFAFNHRIGSKGAIPKEILLNVAEQFQHLRTEGSVYRGTILRAILSAMTYYECLRHNLLFKPCDVYKWFDVDSQTYSKGDKKVREMLDHGFLSEDIRAIDISSSYLHAYASKLELEAAHIKFLDVLLTFITQQKMLNPNAKSSTRALCVMHMFLTSIKHPIRPDEFRKTFRCNYGTVRMLAMDLFRARAALEPLFVENGFEFPEVEVGPSSRRAVRRRANHSRIALD